MKKTILIMLAIILITPTIVKAEEMNQEEQTPPITLTAIYIKTPEAKIGEKVYVELFANKEEITKITGEFVAANNQDTQKIELQELQSEESYFIFEENTKIDEEYELKYIKLSTNNGETVYKTNEKDEKEANYINTFEKGTVKILKNEEQKTNNEYISPVQEYSKVQNIVEEEYNADGGPSYMKEDEEAKQNAKIIFSITYITIIILAIIIISFLENKKTKIEIKKVKGGKK